MKLPRDVSGTELVHSLHRLGYEVVHQVGSHAQLAVTHNGRHKLTIPMHHALRVGTLEGILNAVGRHLGVDRDRVVALIFGD